MYNAMQTLSDQIKDGFQRVQVDLADIELDNLMESMQAIQFAYQEMNDALNNTAVPSQIKKTYIDKYRAACNQPHFTPEDIFRNLYGYACGDKERGCKVGRGEDTGTCKFGVKKRQYMLDIFYESDKNIVTNVKGFGQWLTQVMLLAQFHYGSCLPADAASCSDPFTDPIRMKIGDDMNAAYEEVIRNVVNKMDCVLSEFGSTLEKKQDFYKNIVDNQKCFEDVEKDDKYGQNVNLCMAGKTKAKLDELFFDKHWTVVVYSKRQDDIDLNAEKNMVRLCTGSEDEDDGDSVGCIWSGEVQHDGQVGRFFHLMFCDKNSGKRNLTINPDLIDDNNQPYYDVAKLIEEKGFLTSVARVPSLGIPL
jgi:hypothetical protein